MEDPGSGAHHPFSADCIRTGEGTIIRLSGDLDMASAESFRAVVERVDDGMPVVVDLRGLEFLDSMGLRAILMAAQRDRQTIRFIRGPVNVQRVFEMTKTDDVLEWVEPAD
jgi:anti-anti-sigma factor